MSPPFYAILLVLGTIAGCFLVWKLVLRGVKGVSKAVTAGIAEGRVASNEDKPIKPTEDQNPDLTDELVNATYLLGVSELERAPQAYGYDPDDGLFEPSQAEIDSGTVSMQTLGKAIAKLSPVHPGRRVLEEAVEEQARKVLGAEKAEQIAKNHQQTRVLQILEAGLKARAEADKS